mgnify:CR=1 FL=1
MNAPEKLIGKAVPRREDLRFLTGRGQYTDDITLPQQSYGVFVRSPYAHARLTKVDIAAAQAAPGVLGVFTGEQFKDVGGLPCGWLINSIDGAPMKEPKHPILADSKVRYVGDRVALVVAETLQQAKDAAAMVEVDYEELPSVVDVAQAKASAGGGAVVHDEAPDNLCYHWSIGEREQGVATVSAPVFGRHWRLLGCVCISGPQSRLPQEKLEALAQTIIRTANQLSYALAGKAASTAAQAPGVWHP